MAARYLLDTDICSYLRRNDRPRITERFATLDREAVAISVITLGELAFGMAKSANPARAEQGIAWVMRTMQVLPMSPQAARFYGDIRASLSAMGRPIGPNDLWITAHALAENLILVTNNEREFKRVKGLKVENWAR
jgi:tRNA(fMet)-specific endonuclease VapC